MYPRILFHGTQYRIVFDQAEHSIAGHEGWQPNAIAGEKYLPLSGIGGEIDFTRPKAEGTKTA